MVMFNSETPKEYPLVSVIVPTFNRSSMLKDALKSIYAQTYREFEVIVINDSGEGVESLITAIDLEGRINYIRNRRNKERTYSRNIGLKIARGKYITYLDDDDRFYPDHLETLVEHLEATDYKIAYTDAYRAWIEKEDGEYVIKKRDLPYSQDFDEDEILIQNYIPLICVMHERTCLDKIGLFDEELSAYEDWDLWIRLSRSYKFLHIKKVTAEFSWRAEENLPGGKRRAEFLETMQTIYKRYHPLAVGKPEVISAQQRKLTRIVPKE